MPSSDIRIVDMTTSHPRFPEVRDFLYSIMYEPFGVARDGAWSHMEDDALFKIALDSTGSVVGAARLLPIADDGAGVVRTVATSPTVRGMGVGTLLMHAIEDAAHDLGATHLRLNARIPALGFYERLGYTSVSDEFINPPSGLLHRIMVKELPPHALSA